MRVFLTLRNLVLEYKWYYLGGVAALILADVAQLILPLYLRDWVNVLQTPDATMAHIVPIALKVLGLGAATFLFRMLWRLGISGASRHVDYRLRHAFFEKLTRLSAQYFDNKKTGDLMAHATNDLRAVRMATSMGVILTVDTLFLITSTIVLMVETISLSLTALAIIPLFFMAGTAFLLGKSIHQRFLKVQGAFSDLSDLIQENLSGIRVVKGYVQEKEELENLTTYNQAYVDRNMELVRIWGLLNPMVEIIAGISFVVALTYGSMMVISGTISLGSLVAFVSYLGLLAGPMEETGWLINLLQRGAASMQRLHAVYTAHVHITEAEDAQSPERMQGGIEVKNLTFTYPGSHTPALRDVSFSLPAGGTLALIGRTGSGKSTLLDLLLRIYEPPEGTVFIDRHDVRSLSFSFLRENIGYVPPDNFLFSDTIRENIAFGKPGVGSEEVEHATEIAQVRDNIEDFPRKFDTVLGERGITLSGGQQQRVAIARAIAKHPAILMLDDSLSAVDTRTEDRILRQLKDLQKNRTTIIVAHRISTIKHADLILVLDHGRIVQRGQHEELVAEEGLYASLNEKQLLQEKIGSEEEVGA